MLIFSARSGGGGEGAQLTSPSHGPTPYNFQSCLEKKRKKKEEKEEEQVKEKEKEREDEP